MIEITDPITQTLIANPGSLVENTAQLESIHIQSPLFDPVAYLAAVHRDTDSGTFHAGI